EKGEGTGLGLAVVHGIISSHGGAITVESEIGKGTTFHVIFPKRNQISTEDKPAATAAPARQEGTERILFVDDEPALIDIGKEILASLGYRVTSCTASDDALSRFKEDPERFDLVITDLTMPKMTGDLLAQELMRIRPDIPVILFTGYSDLVSRERFNQLGIRDCLMKPLTRRDLAASIRRVIDRPPEAPEDPADDD
ncbi:MAG: response regulator, partial [Desulfobacterales bacterium]